MIGAKPELTKQHFDAVLFDLDGVLTDTARIHATAWRLMFDEFLARRASATGEPYAPFDVDAVGDVQKCHSNWRLLGFRRCCY